MRHDGRMTSLDYDLHKLGWRAFQDLCAVIMQEVLGQTFHTFADTNDAGRDGAFHGHWSVSTDAPDNEVAPIASAGTAAVAQCKFSARQGKTLTPTMLDDEIMKVSRLHEQGLCDAYILLTNLRVTGRTEAWVRKEVAAVGVTRTLVLDGFWVCQQISKRADLRRYVPRVYGLGDLGKILDDRRLRQAQALMTRLRDDIQTFVPTEAYRRAADSVATHRFVLLLGEPACGKSTIAATLAIAALDNWGCGVRRVDSAAELVAAWDPDEPDQLFWIDDAFGGIQHDPALTDGWSRRMDQVMTAVEKGARIILTSRDYIYRDARAYLKEYAYPRLREHQVVVDVAELTTREKEEILYNHLKAGDQPRSVLQQWSPHLHQAADVVPFQPEVARRLAHRAFTARAQLSSGDELRDYVAHPVVFLADVLRELDPAKRSALACVYLAGTELAVPVTFTPALSDAVIRLGATEAEVMRAFAAIDGTFLQKAENTHGDPVWRFRHPTIREGFAAVVAEDTNAVSVFLDGLAPDELVEQIDCGGPTNRGTLVRVPSSLYPLVIPRVSIPTDSERSWLNPKAWFLQRRCSPDFLRAWAAYHVAVLPQLLNFGSYVSAVWQPQLLGLLHQAGALPEPIRRDAVNRLSELALGFDGGWLDDPICGLFSPAERAALLDRIRGEILPDIENHIRESADGYESDVEPRDRYQPAREAIDMYKRAFRDNPAVVVSLGEAMRYLEEQVDYEESDFTPSAASPLAGTAAPEASTPAGRNEFDDVADGH